jgi:hypothetical protein
MKKYLKYLIIALAVLVIAALVWYIASHQKSVSNSNQAANQATKSTQAINNLPPVLVVDDSIMTAAERKKFKLGTDVKVEVLSRNASGTPMAYKLLTADDITAEIKDNAAIESNLKADDGLSLMSDEEKRNLRLDHLAAYEVVTRGDTGKITSYRFLYFDAPKDVKPEFMSEQEKASRGVPASMKIQILEKNNAGEPVVYKIIRKDSDVVAKY